MLAWHLKDIDRTLLLGGQQEVGLKAYRKALTIHLKLVLTYLPAHCFREGLAKSQTDIDWVHLKTGRLRKR